MGRGMCWKWVRFASQTPSPENRWHARPLLSMYSCRNCCLYFKYPRLTKEQYDAFCKQGDPGHWQFQPQARRDWLLTKDILDRGCNGGKILDVGCWNGQFLEYIGNGRWEHFGIELNPVAADFARQRGLRIAATNFS